MKIVPATLQKLRNVSTGLALLLAVSLSGFCTSAAAAQARLVIDSPHGGEYFLVGQQQSVRVTTRLKHVTVELSRDGGNTFDTLGAIDALDSDLAKRSSLSWAVTAPASSVCVIRISSGAFSATSGMFTIAAGATLPEGGGAVALADGSVNTSLLTDGAVTTAKLAGSAVTVQKLSDLAVTTPKIADQAVTTPKIADLSVTAAKVNSGAASAQMVLAADGNGGADWAALNLPSFDQLGSGTNTTSTLIVGSGASLDVTGAGSITANKFNGVLPVANGGTGASNLLGLVVGNGTSPATALKVNLNATTVPAATDDNSKGYAMGSRWICTPTNDEYLCTNASAGAAVWKKTTPASSNSAAGTSTGYDLQLPSATSAAFMRMAYDRNTNTLFAGTQATTVLKINPDTGVYTTISLTPTTTGDVASLTTDGTYLYASVTDYTNPATVYKVDIASGSIVATWTIPSTYPSAAAFVGGKLYFVSDEFPSKLFQIDPNTGTQSNYTLSINAAYTLAFDGTYLWSSSDDGSGNVGRFNVGASTPDPTAYLGLGDYFDGLVYDNVNNCLWTVKLNGNALVKFSTTGALIGTYSLGISHPYNVVFDGTFLWVSANAGAIAKVNAALPSNAVRFQIASGAARAIAVCDASVWAANGSAPGNLYRFPINTTAVDYHIASETLTTAPTNTIPSLLIDPALPPTFVSAATGTYFGVSGASNFTGNLADLQLNGTSIFKVSNNTTTVGGSGGLAVNGPLTIGANNNFTQNGTGTFTTASGNVNLNGNVTVASGKNFTQSGAGTFSTGTGAVSINGNLAQTGAGTFSTGTGTVSINGNLALASGKTFSQTGTGTFSTGTGAISLNGPVTLAGKLTVPTGASGSAGNATLAGGTVTVSTTACSASSIIICTYTTVGGTQGFLRVSAGAGSFTITSSSATDTSHVNWWIVN